MYYRYVTGRSRSTNLTFSKSWAGFESFHDAFVKWARSTYCGWTSIRVHTSTSDDNPSLAEEERARRRGFATSIVEAVSPRSNTPNTSNPNVGNHTSPTTNIPSTPDDHLLTTVNEAEVRSVLDPDPAGEGENLVAGCEDDSDATAEGKDQLAPVTAAEVDPRPPTPVPNSQLSSGDISSPHPTTPTHATQDAGSASSQLIPGPGAFVSNGAVNFITSSTISYLETISGGQRWTEMVRDYLVLEKLPKPKGVRSPFFFCLTFALTMLT